MLCIWKIPAAVAAGWWAIWPEMGSRSAVTGYETSCTAWGFGRSTGSLAPRFPGLHPNASPAWLISARSQLWIRFGPPISPTSRSRRVSFNWWRSWISPPDTCSAGSSRTALTRSSALRLWRWRWKEVASQGSSIPVWGVSSPRPPSLPGCRARRSRFAGQEGKATTTTSWSRGCGAPSITRVVYLHAYSDGWEAEISLAGFCAGTPMEGLTAPLEAALPMRSILRKTLLLPRDYYVKAKSAQE